MPHINEGPLGAIVIDDRYLPMIVTSFFGEIELAQGQWYEVKLARTILAEYQRGHKVVSINDATHVPRSSAEMRKFWAEAGGRHAETMQDKTLRNSVVITNSVMRGVMTAVSWLNPKMAAVEIYPSLDSAVHSALALLAAAGTPAPVPMGRYQLPHGALHLIPAQPKRA